MFREDTPARSPGGAGLRVALWVAIPVVLHLLVFARFSSNAPILDDFDCILNSLDFLSKAGTAKEWFTHVFALQNEHRLAATRLIGQLQVWTLGGVDFRLLMLLGTFCVLGIFAFVWSEFRAETTGPIAAAAAFLLLQWSYWEALLMASASTAHLAVAFLSVAALYYALRPGWLAATLCAAGGVAAAFSQANGLFVLPLAGVACVLLGPRRRGVAFLVLAAAIWALYFIGYSKPSYHPSLLSALDDPVRFVQLFLIIVGGISPTLGVSALAGAVIMVCLAWITWEGLWRRHPTAFLWIVFVLISAGTVAIARVGFGLFWGSRYSINTGLLMAILTFAVFSLTRPWRPRAELVAMAAAGVLWAAILIEALPHIRERAFRLHVVAEVDKAGQELGLPRFVGLQHPNEPLAARVLDMAQVHGWYAPPRIAVSRPVIALTDTRPAAGPPVGVMDEITAKGSTVHLRGWTAIPAAVPDRKIIVYSRGKPYGATLEALQVREDVAAGLLKPDLIVSGFRIVLGFDSEEKAREAAQSVCVFEEAPGRPITEIRKTATSCK